MRILVTGGSGVVGAGAIPALWRAGHDVRLLSRHAERDVASFPAGVEAFAADIADPKPLRSAVAGCDAVLHVAGIVQEKPPEITFEKMNVAGTRHLLEAAAGAGAPFFIYVSSLGAERGESAYHRSKRQAEELVRRYAGPWLILRPGNVYGPGDETISMLLKMVRTLPAVPIVDDGRQPFQPVWHADFGCAVTRVVADRTLAGRTLELAGPEVTTTLDVLDRIAAITRLDPPRLPVPAWLARMGTQALDAMGAAGRSLLERGGVGVPLNPAKLSMLLEGSVLSPGGENALVDVLGVTPTPLQEGLEMLADLLPEQMPGAGVGALRECAYAAEIRGSKFSAAALIAHVCERITDIMPIEFAAEPNAPRRAEEGATLTAEIKGRGHVQVRLEERTETRVTFATLEGHPLAGVMQLEAQDMPGGVRFLVRTTSQAADVVDWVAMKSFGETLQTQNWREVVRRVVAASGGEAPEGVRRESRAVGEDEQSELRRWLGGLVQRQQRKQREAMVR